MLRRQRLLPEQRRGELSDRARRRKPAVRTRSGEDPLLASRSAQPDERPRLPGRGGGRRGREGRGAAPRRRRRRRERRLRRLPALGGGLAVRAGLRRLRHGLGGPELPGPARAPDAGPDSGHRLPRHRRPAGMARALDRLDLVFASGDEQLAAGMRTLARQSGKLLVTTPGPGRQRRVPRRGVAPPPGAAGREGRGHDRVRGRLPGGVHPELGRSAAPRPRPRGWRRGRAGRPSAGWAALVRSSAPWPPTPDHGTAPLRRPHGSLPGPSTAPGLPTPEPLVRGWPATPAPWADPGLARRVLPPPSQEDVTR